MAGTATEQILILIAFGLEHFGHLVVRFDPVVHAVAHDVGVEQIPIAHGDEQADWQNENNMSPGWIQNKRRNGFVIQLLP